MTRRRVPAGILIANACAFLVARIVLLLTVHHESRCPDACEVAPDVDPVQVLEQRGRHLAARGLALEAREGLRHRRIVGALSDEELRQCAGAEAPVAADERHDRAPDLRAADQPSARERPVENQPVHELGTAGREDAGERTSLRDPEHRHARGALGGDDGLERVEVRLEREVGTAPSSPFGVGLLGGLRVTSATRSDTGIRALRSARQPA